MLDLMKSLIENMKEDYIVRCPFCKEKFRGKTERGAKIVLWGHIIREHKEEVKKLLEKDETRVSLKSLEAAVFLLQKLERMRIDDLATLLGIGKEDAVRIVKLFEIVNSAKSIEYDEETGVVEVGL